MPAPAPAKRQLSAPFASREFNGVVLLEEIDQLRDSQIGQKHLHDCALAMRELDGLRLSEAAQKIRNLASGRFAAQPALASLLVRWAGRLKSELDVPQLVGHFERLALSAALISAIRRRS